MHASNKTVVTQQALNATPTFPTSIEPPRNPPSLEIKRPEDTSPLPESQAQEFTFQEEEVIEIVYRHINHFQNEILKEKPFTPKRVKAYYQTQANPIDVSVNEIIFSENNIAQINRIIEEKKDCLQRIAELIKIYPLLHIPDKNKKSGYYYFELILANINFFSNKDKNMAPFLKKLKDTGIYTVFEKLKEIAEEGSQYEDNTWRIHRDSVLNRAHNYIVYAYRLVFKDNTSFAYMNKDTNKSPDYTSINRLKGEKFHDKDEKFICLLVELHGLDFDHPIYKAIVKLITSILEAGYHTQLFPELKNRKLFTFFDKLVSLILLRRVSFRKVVTADTKVTQSVPDASAMQASQSDDSAMQASQSDDSTTQASQSDASPMQASQSDASPTQSLEHKHEAKEVEALASLPASDFQRPYLVPPAASLFHHLSPIGTPKPISSSSIPSSKHPGAESELSNNQINALVVVLSEKELLENVPLRRACLDQLAAFVGLADVSKIFTNDIFLIATLVQHKKFHDLNLVQPLLDIFSLLVKQTHQIMPNVNAPTNGDTIMPEKPALGLSAQPAASMVPNPSLLNFPTQRPMAPMVAYSPSLNFSAQQPMASMVPNPPSLNFPAQQPTAPMVPNPPSLNFPAQQPMASMVSNPPFPAQRPMAPSHPVLDPSAQPFTPFWSAFRETPNYPSRVHLPAQSIPFNGMMNNMKPYPSS